MIRGCTDAKKWKEWRNETSAMEEIAQHCIARHAVLLALRPQVQEERAEIFHVSAGSRRRKGVRRLQGERKRGDEVSSYRYRLQRKEDWIIRRYNLGNRSIPVHSWRWKDIYASDDYDALANLMKEIVAKDYGKLHKMYRIEDTERAFKRPQTEGKEQTR